MNETIAHAFDVAAFWTCFVSAAGVLGIGGATLLNKLDDAIRSPLEQKNKSALGSPRS